MPDSYDYSQKPQRRGTQNVPSPPLTTFLLMGISLAATLPRLIPGLLQEPIWQQVYAAFNGSRYQIWDGQYYLLFTAIFSHVDILHLLFNMMMLFTLATELEITVGPLLLMLFVVVSAVVTSCAELAVGHNGVGFSGVIYAMFGMMWAGRGSYPAWATVANIDNFRWMVGWAVFSIFTSWLGWMQVGNAAHFSGLLFGLSIGFAFLAPRKRLLWTIPLALLIILAILTLTVMPHSLAWLSWKLPFGALFHVFPNL